MEAEKGNLSREMERKKIKNKSPGGMTQYLVVWVYSHTFPRTYPTEVRDVKH